MTERFKIGLDLITIEDTSKEYGALNQDEVVDLLNELHEENQQLKKEIENLKQGLIHAAFDKEWK
jgi:cell division protein FtsB